jgi:hypothetical protein
MMFVRCSQRTIAPLKALISGRAVEVIAAPLFCPEELRRVFPSQEDSDSNTAVKAGPPSPVTPTSGLAGRPTSKHLYMEEAARRIASENCPDSLAGLVRELQSWLPTAHPDMPLSGHKAIENAIRPLWRGGSHKSGPLN